MRKSNNINKHFKFIMYLAVVILINIAGITLFFRTDMTANKIYSLSEASKNAVATLSDPLTIKVFFTENLPAPYNNIERYLHDLLEEYSLAGNRFFNYQFYNVSSEEQEEAGRNKELASSYGIPPVQVRNIEQDEVKFQKAYMGLAMIHGDVIETIPAITSTDGLEYKITNKIRQMNNKISALLNLKEKVNIMLFLSSSLQAVGPYMNLPGLSDVPKKIEEIVSKLNAKHYNKLAFRYYDPSHGDAEAEEKAIRYNALKLQWNEFKDRRGQMIPGDKGFAGLVVQHGDKYEPIQLINVIRIPIFGTQYQMMDSDTLEQVISESVENVLDINEEIGYLTSHGCLELAGPSMPGQPQRGEAGNFNALLSKEYSIKPIDLKNDAIPDGLASLIIAGPKDTFTDYELYQIDQFLMKGKNVIFFLDMFREIVPQQNPNQMMFRQNQQPIYLPINTGLDKLLKHYGLAPQASYVLDENCFKQRVPQNYGGGEMPIYFAPIIKGEWINNDFSIMKNIKGLAMLKASPINVNETKLTDNQLKASRLLSSTDKAWEMKGRIDLNPMLMRPPADDQRKSFALAYVLEGEFPSYYADKPMPEKEESKTGDAAAEKADKEDAGIDTSKITTTGMTIKRGKPGKIFLACTSEILKDNIVDNQGSSPNANFLMNVIDYFNNREAYALMRTKTLGFNPLEDIKPQRKLMIKFFNIAGLPATVIIAGLLVWFRRASRRRMIQNMFRQ